MTLEEAELDPDWEKVREDHVAKNLQWAFRELRDVGIAKTGGYALCNCCGTYQVPQIDPLAVLKNAEGREGGRYNILLQITDNPMEAPEGYNLVTLDNDEGKPKASIFWRDA